jgi:OOP family OmpA-OmpF porin
MQPVINLANQTLSVFKIFIMKKVMLIAVLLIGATTIRAQFVYDYLRAADNYFKKADYYSAAQYYEKYLNANPVKMRQEEYKPYTVRTTTSKKKNSQLSSRQQAVYQLAESYRLLHYPARAEPWYKEAVEFDKEQFPLARFHYATVLRALEKYEEAEKAFISFLDEYKTDDAYSEAARKEILSLRFVRSELQKKDLKLYTVQKADALNSAGANYAAVWLNDNTLLFTSTRPDSTAGKNGVYTNRIYQAAYAEGNITNVTRAGLPQAKDVHQGVVSLSPDRKHMFLTRWTTAGEKKNSSIYISEWTEAGWSEPVPADAVINAEGANAQQPFVMPDGKYLLYASDKPGGYGGFDLYAAELGPDGKPKRSFNLGSTINTSGDEQAPYYHAASGTLVFSSNSRIGMGGFDFYYSKGTIDKWEEPVNFGYPVNSVKDDIYFVSRGGAKNILEDVFLSSDRMAECCLEMFYLKKIRPMRQISGTVVACDNATPIKGAVVRIVDTINNVTVYSHVTGEDGRYTFRVEDYQPLKAIASSDGFETGSLHFFAPADTEAESLTNPALCLVKIVPEVEEVIVMENVYYDYDKYVLKPESYPSLDKIVEMLNENPTMEIEVAAHTDGKGTDDYNLKLSEQRAKSVVDYLISKGIDKSRLQAKGYGATMPIAPNTNPDGSDNPEGREKNRRTEFKVLKK